MIQNEYDERFLNARSPCTIDGYVGSTKNVWRDGASLHHLAQAHTLQKELSATQESRMELNSCSNIIHDCGATDTLFRTSDAHLLTGPYTAGTLCVGLPNGEVIHSYSSANFDSPNFSTKVHVFPDKLLNRSLMATADFYNNGCTAIFTSTTATIIHDETGHIISRASKDPQARLWPFFSQRFLRIM